MTGNNKFWRASLAGLASVAMLATMGVTALTASANDSTAPADVTVSFKAASNGSFSGSQAVTYGNTLADAVRGALSATATPAAGYKFVGFGDFNFDAPLTSNVDLTAQFAADDQATAVRFVNADGTPYIGGQFREGNETDSTIYVAKNSGVLAPTRVPVDKADGSVVVDWKVTVDGVDKGTVTTASLLKDGYKIGRSKGDAVFTAKTVSPANVIAFDKPSDAGATLVGAYADGETTDTAYYADVVKDGPAVVAPAVVYTAGSDNSVKYLTWSYGNNLSVAVGAAVPVDIANGTHLTASKATASKQFQIDFDSNGGSAVASQYVAEGGYAVKPADPTLKGQVFKGWKADDPAYNSDRDGFFDWAKPVRKALTLKAQWAVTDTLTVTFHAGDYKDAPKDVTVEVAGDAFIDASKVPDFTREGYTIDHWFVDKNNNGAQDAGEQEFDVTTDLAGLANDGNDFTLVPAWEAVDENIAKSALKYVTIGLKDQFGIGSEVEASDKNDFTAESWAEFEPVYKAQYQKYVSAAYTNSDGVITKNDVPAKTSAEIVNALKDAWEKLQFKHTDGQEPVPGDDPTTKLAGVHRLYSPSKNEHFYSNTKVEIAQLTSTQSTSGNWNDEGVLFYTYAGNKYKDSPKGTTPIVKEYIRFYNPTSGDHVWTLKGGEEYKTLAAAKDWNEEGTGFVTPTFTGSVDVVRLYNPALNRHVLSTDPAEQALLAGKGWNVEGVSAKGI